MKNYNNIKEFEYYFMIFKFFQVVFLILIISTAKVFSQHPISKYKGISDPHIRVFNDTVFLYSGHDSAPDDKTWIMKDWRIFSTTDLVDWKLEGTISPKANYMEDNTIDCWASDAATRNEKYYFYFSDRKRGVGVMVSDLPIGPFKDALGKPLVAPMHDPTILIDDDQNKTPYLVYGDKEGGGFHIAQLNEDMISIKGNSKPIKIIGKEWNNAPDWMDKNYLFKNKDTYYLSWGRDYAISKNIYGPYKCVGAVGNGHNLNEYAHGSFFWWKGQFYHMWCYYIRPGYRYRDIRLTYCHFSDDGQIVTDTDFLDKHLENGVAQYDASWSKIQAEWYYEKTEEIVKKGNAKDGFVVSRLKNGSWLKFPNMTFNKEYTVFSSKLKVLSGSGKLEIRQDELSGRLLGAIEISNKENQTEFTKVSCNLTKLDGKIDIFLKFIGTADSRFELDWFRFSN